FDLYRGPHFSLLGFGNEAADALTQVTWPPGGAPLARYAIADSVKEADSALAQTYGIAEDTQILVRPDGYIAHIATRDWDHSLADIARWAAPTSQVKP
ncbi:MAG: hypothetical protein QOC67_1728, partial [Pseudonocardiales bacterium]|nr:hypothetical protein [Pseudonocardiales bacterium]